MKKLYLFIGLVFSSFLFSQTLIGNVNSGAVSDTGFMHSVGEIYVIPTDENKTNSGTMGMVYQTLSVLGVEELEVNAVKVYPNPTTRIINFSLNSKSKVEDVQIYDLAGKFIKNIKITNKMVDVAFLSSGIYFLRFKDLDLKTIKIIKK